MVECSLNQKEYFYLLNIWVYPFRMYFKASQPRKVLLEKNIKNIEFVKETSFDAKI